MWNLPNMPKNIVVTESMVIKGRIKSSCTIEVGKMDFPARGALKEVCTPRCLHWQPICTVVMTVFTALSANQSPWGNEIMQLVKLILYSLSITEFEKELKWTGSIDCNCKTCSHLIEMIMRICNINNITKISSCCSNLKKRRIPCEFLGLGLIWFLCLDIVHLAQQKAMLPAVRKC